MTDVIHRESISDGEITIFSDGSYIVVAGHRDSPEASTTHYGRGRGPYRYQILAERVLSRQLREVARARSVERLPPNPGALHEDVAGVPEHMRSSASRWASDQRLRDPRHRDDERLRRERLRLALVLGTRLGRLHAYLYELIATVAVGEPLVRHGTGYITPLSRMGPQSLPQPVSMAAWEMIRAIESGVLIIGPDHRPVIADFRRGYHNNIAVQLDRELPGIAQQYNYAFEHERSRIADGYFGNLLLAVLDVLEGIISLGIASALIRAVRNAFRTSLSALIEGRAQWLARSGVGEVVASVPRGAIDATPELAERRAHQELQRREIRRRLCSGPAALLNAELEPPLP